MPKPNKNFEKPKNLKLALKNLVSYSKKYIPFVIVSMVFASVGAILSLIGPNKLKDLTNLITEGMMSNINMRAVLSICFLLVGIYSLSFILTYLQSYIMSRVTHRVTQKLRNGISNKINNLPLKYLDSNKAGDILSRITNDVDQIGMSLSGSVVNLISSICLLVGSILMMFITNWILAITAIVSTIFGLFIMMIIMSKSQKYFIANQMHLGSLNGHIEEVYSGHNVIRAYNAEYDAKAKFDEVNTKLYQSGWKSQFLSGLMQPIMAFIGNFGYVCVCIVGAILVSNGVMSFGVIVAFMLYVRLFTQPISQLAQVATSIQSAGAASERVFEFLNEKELEDESQKKNYLSPQNIIGNVKFKNVRFAYNKEKVIIKNFSADIKPGQKIAIVGPTGAGKTTMVNLLMRFYELKKPVLIVNGEKTNYKIFNNGKSIRLDLIENNLIINGKKTNYILSNKFKNLFKNGEIKFDQNFNVYVGENKTDKKIDIITGNSIETTESVELGIAYYGDIFVDGEPIGSLKRENIHNLFSMVLQDTWTFEGSVIDNIKYSKTDILDERIIEVCKACGIHHFIKTLPNGYNTILNENITISAGQKQLLTIARAMIEDAPMLILDEATSSVDTRMELVIQKAMDKLTEGRTSFVIAHRLSTIKNADQIIVMKDGDIIEVGNHKALLKQNGFYANLYKSQFQQN